MFEIIKQKNEKDCLQCCLASLLNIDYNSIPKFYELYDNIFLEENRNWTKDESNVFTKSFDSWLDSLGYCRIVIDCLQEDAIIFPFYISKKDFYCIGILKKKDRYYSHCVILDIQDFKQESFKLAVYDPKENSDYTSKDLIQIEFIIKKEM